MIDYAFRDFCKKNDIEHPTLSAWAEFRKTPEGKLFEERQNENSTN